MNLKGIPETLKEHPYWSAWVRKDDGGKVIHHHFKWWFGDSPVRAKCVAA